MQSIISFLRRRVGSKLLPLFAVIAVLAGATSALAVTYQDGYITTGQTGAQTFINAGATSSFYVAATTDTAQLVGGNFTMKKDSTAALNIFLTLYENGVEVAKATQTPSAFTGNFAPVVFTFPTPYVLKPGRGYRATLTSSVVNTSTYYIKGADGCTVSTSGGVSISGTQCSANPIPGTPLLSVSKSGPTTGVVGVTATYTLDVTNNGSAAATTAQVKDKLPAGFTYVSGTGTGWSCSNSSGLVTCNYSGSIGVNATSRITIKATPTVEASPATNRVSVGPSGGSTAKDPATCTEADYTNGVCDSFDTAVTAPAEPFPYLNIAISDPVGPLAAGSESTYTVTVTNTGTADSTGTVHAYFVVPEGATWVSGGNDDWTCGTPSGDPLVADCTTTATIGFEDADGVNFPVKISIPANAPGGTSYTADAYINRSGGTVETPPETCSSGDTTDCASQASELAGGFTIDKSAPSPALSINQESTYTITVTSGTSQPIEVKDKLPAGLTYVNAYGDDGNWACSFDAASSTVLCANATPAAGADEKVFVTVRVEPTLNAKATTNLASVGHAGETPEPGQCTDPSQCAASSALVDDVRDEIKKAVEDDVQAYLGARLDQLIGSFDSQSRISRFRNTACGVSHDVSMSGEATSNNANLSANGTFSMKGGIVPTADAPPEQCSNINVWAQLDVGYVDGLEDSSATGGMVTVGAEYLITDNFLAGARLSMDYTDAQFDSAANSEISGYGWLAGPYISAEIANNLFLDGFIGYGTSWNDYDGNYEGLDLSGDFTSQRIAGYLNLSGTYQTGMVLLTPLVGVSYGKEWSESFKVSNAIVGDTGIDGQDAELGRLKGRIEAGYLLSDYADERFELFLAPQVTYDFVRNAGPDGEQLLGDGLWRGGLEGGFRFARDQFGASLVLGYDGVGVSDWNGYHGQLQLNYTW